MTLARKQNITLSLRTEVIQKARSLAVKRSTSISGMLADALEALVNTDETQQRASASAIARMERGLHLGGGRPASRDQLHER